MPNHSRDSTAPDVEAMTSGTKVVPRKRLRMTSCANSTPAIGALNEADTALATPQANSVRAATAGRLKRRHSAAAIEAPRCTTGPSRPALAPAPSDRALVMPLPMPLHRPSRSLPCSRASMTSGTA